MRRPTHSIAIGAIFFETIFCGFLITGRNGYAANSVVAPRAAKPVAVFTEKIADKPVFDTLTYPAQIESRVNAMILAESDGVITKIPHPLGAKIRRGEIVAIIRHTDPIYQYQPFIVRAPVTGVINEVYLTRGALVKKGDKLLSITAPNKLRIMIDVAAQDVPFIHSGLVGQLTVSDQSQSLPVTVEGISPSINPMLGTASCELTASKAVEKNLEPGLVGVVTFKVNKRNAFVVPQDAVVYEGNRPYIQLVLANDIAKRIPVKLGELNDGKIEILSGLKSGEQIIDRSAGFVADGARVKIMKSTE